MSSFFGPFSFGVGFCGFCGSYQNRRNGGFFVVYFCFDLIRMPCAFSNIHANDEFDEQNLTIFFFDK